MRVRVRVCGASASVVMAGRAQRKEKNAVDISGSD